MLCDRNTQKGHDWTCVINQDLPRTFPGHPALGEDGLNALRRMLTAYARHNPAVGYCQVLRCLFFLGMTCDDALELPHTIEGALCRQTLLFLFKVCIPTHVIPTLVKIHLNPSGNYISALVKTK